MDWKTEIDAFLAAEHAALVGSLEEIRNQSVVNEEDYQAVSGALDEMTNVLSEFRQGKFAPALDFVSRELREKKDDEQQGGEVTNEELARLESFEAILQRYISST